MKAINPSYQTLRKTIGALGMLLPFVLILGNHFTVEKSISYYYYTKMSTVFTGVVLAFGLVLITYRGTDQTPGFFNENILTHLAGAFAILVALVPTRITMADWTTLHYAHDDMVRGWIHNGVAVLFILLMSVIVFFKFGYAPYYRILYRVLGVGVFMGLVFAIISFLLKDDDGTRVIKSGVFWGETFSLVMFGIAWLRRGIPKKHPVE